MIPQWYLHSCELHLVSTLSTSSTETLLKWRPERLPWQRWQDKIRRLYLLLRCLLRSGCYASFQKWSNQKMSFEGTRLKSEPTEPILKQRFSILWHKVPWRCGCVSDAISIKPAGASLLISIPRYEIEIWFTPASRKRTRKRVSKSFATALPYIKQILRRC